MHPGFHFDDLINVFTFNLFSRILGFIMRISVICMGLVFMIILFMILLVLVLIWPVLFPLTLIFFLVNRLSPKNDLKTIVRKNRNNFQNLCLASFTTPIGRFTLMHLGIEYFSFIKEIKSFKIREINLEFKHMLVKYKETSFPAFFADLMPFFEPFKRLSDKYELHPEDIYNTAFWYQKLESNNKKNFLLDFETIRNLPGIGSEWSYGYTVEFDRFAHDLTFHVSSFPLLIGREKEIKKIELILSKNNKNNVLIMGDPGVGRHIIVETLAHRLKTGQCPKILSHKRVLSLDIHALISAKPTIAEVKGLLSSILEEAEYAGNVIIVIDDLDKFISNEPGRFDLSDVISKFIDSPVAFIGITTPYSYYRYMEQNTSLNLVFENIEICIPDKKTVLEELLISVVPVLERKYNAIITYKAVLKTIEDSERYITKSPFPSKAIELLDECSGFLIAQNKGRILYPENVEEFLEEKFKMPLGELDTKEKEKLLNMEKYLHERIINQNEAISSISSALRRSRLKVSSKNKPIGSFLFLGPTGVGKTETAKALASIYFGSSSKLIRFDMSEYRNDTGIDRLLGNSVTGSAGELTSAISDNPFSIILLDEFEKTSKDIYNLLLTLIDEGYIADYKGHKVYARNSIIIATSNAGAEYIREYLISGQIEVELSNKLLDYLQKECLFSPELLNRFDKVVVFTPLSEGHLREIVKLMLKDLNTRLETKEISLDITPDLVKRLASVGFNPQFGARAINRLIADKIEDDISRRLLTDSVKKGDKIVINL
jgi:ATP-dependent Clp protease ATP-binding subunit ClpC